MNKNISLCIIVILISTLVNAQDSRLTFINGNQVLVQDINITKDSTSFIISSNSISNIVPNRFIKEIETIDRSLKSHLISIKQVTSETLNVDVTDAKISVSEYTNTELAGHKLFLSAKYDYASIGLSIGSIALIFITGGTNAPLIGIVGGIVALSFKIASITNKSQAGILLKKTKPH